MLSIDEELIGTVLINLRKNGTIMRQIRIEKEKKRRKLQFEHIAQSQIDVGLHKHAHHDADHDRSPLGLSDAGDDNA